MRVITVLCTLVWTVVSASLKVKEERRKAFFGEDIHIDVPPGDAGEVVFKSRTNALSEVVLLQAGNVVNPRGHLNSLGHLVLEDVQKGDEGMYVIKNTHNPNTVKHLILTVRDCSLEQVVKYGDSYYIYLNHVEGPIVLSFRPSLIHHTNHSDMQHATELPAVLLYNQTTVLAEEYVGRLHVSEKRVMLHSVRMSDEGSFTVIDREGKVRRRNCLNVREHQNFIRLSHGENLQVPLFLPYSNVNVVYRPKSDNQDRVVLDQGVLITPLDPVLEGRLSAEGTMLLMKKVRMADSGVFKVTDLSGFTVAHVYVDVEAYKLPSLTVAILALLSLIAFMLLVCLLSCLYKVHKRNKKNKKLTLIAQQAGKGEGEAFRQVVHEAYTRFTEESLMQSVCDQPTDSTEVTIKGLEVSKPGRYHVLASDNNFLEMSDSGVEFTSPALPLDSDTDVPLTYASSKPLLYSLPPTAVMEGPHSDSQETTMVPDGDLSTGQTPDSVLSASPSSSPRSFAAVAPNGSLCNMVSPASGPQGAAGSNSDADAGQKEESSPST